MNRGGEAVADALGWKPGDDEALEEQKRAILWYYARWVRSRRRRLADQRAFQDGAMAIPGKRRLPGQPLIRYARARSSRPKGRHSV